MSLYILENVSDENISISTNNENIIINWNQVKKN